ASAELKQNAPALFITILRAKPRHVLNYRLELLYRVLAGVVNDITRVEPDLEVRLIYLFQAALDLLGCAAGATVRLQDYLEAFLLSERGRFAHQLIIIIIEFRVIDTEGKTKFSAKKPGILDLLAHVFDLFVQREIVVRSQGAHVQL